MAYDPYEGMFYGTLPQDTQDFSQVLSGVGRSLGDIRRGVSYLPYDLLGSGVDVANLALGAAGLGSERPVLGSDYLRNIARSLGLAEESTGSATESLARLGAGVMSPAMLQGIARVGKMIEDPTTYAKMLAPLSRPQVTTEATVTGRIDPATGQYVTGPRTLTGVSGSPQGELMARQRFGKAAEPMLAEDVTPRVGYWAGETNPMFVSEMPRMMDVSKQKEALRQVAQTAQNLEQEGAAITRAVKLPFGDISEGNAAFLTKDGKPLTKEDIVKLNKSFGEANYDNAVLQHRKDGSGLVFAAWDDKYGLGQFINKAKEVLPNLKIEPALARQDIDRVYMDMAEYAKYGAVPRTESPGGLLTEAFDEALKRLRYRD
jgi:hypothetical protein